MFDSDTLWGLPTTVLLGLVGVFSFTLIAGLVLAHFAPSLKLLAEPGEHRQHRLATPMVGGMAMCLGIFFGFILLDNTLGSLLPALLFLCIVGALDDRYTLPSWVRFLAQGIAIYLVIRMTGVKLETLGYLTPNSEFLLGQWSIPMTIFASIGVINAVNMSDGLDGLAGTLVLVCLIALLITGGGSYLALIVIAALSAFLSLNLRVFRSQARIFMGDAGSTMLGLLLAYCLIKQSQTQSGIWPVTALWFLALPLSDAVAVLIVRPLRGKSPFAADRIHYHHQLVDRGMGVNMAVFIAVSLQSCFIAFGIWALQVRLAAHIQLLSFLTFFGLYLLSLLWFTRKSNDRLSKSLV